MRYEEFRKLAVSCSDLRTMQIDGFNHCEEPIPGVAFMKPFIVMERDHPVIERFDCLGYVTRDDNRGVWDVEIYNTGKEFVDLEKAIRYLWDEHVRDECECGRFRLIAVDSDGEVITNMICDDWASVVKRLKLELPDPEYHRLAIEALSKVGSRYFEFPHGHYAAFPLDD